MSISVRDIEEAAKAILNADGLIIGAGAGMGVDSGLPDFRGQQGFWRAYPALAEAGYDFTEIANPAAFTDNPEMAWGFYGHRFNLYKATRPHLGFEILRSIGKQFPHSYQVFTSNVDSHFQSSGFNAEKIYECHGSIFHLQCSQSCREEIWSAKGLKIVTDEKRCLATSGLPMCRYCSEIARPNILMFGDYHWISYRSDRQARLLNKNIQCMKKPVVIECGAGTAVPTVRYFCERLSAPLIRINPRDYHADKASTISLPVGALQGLLAINEKLESLGFYN